MVDAPSVNAFASTTEIALPPVTRTVPKSLDEFLMLMLLVPTSRVSVPAVAVIAPESVNVWPPAVIRIVPPPAPPTVIGRFDETVDPEYDNVAATPLPSVIKLPAPRELLAPELDNVETDVVPLPRATVPVKLLPAPLSVNDPAPSLVRPPVVVVMFELTTVLPTPPIVRF